MTELVKDDQYTQANNGRDYGIGQTFHRRISFGSDQPTSDEALWRAQRSISRIVPTSLARRLLCRCMVLSIIRCISRNPILPAKNAATATSLAPLSTAGIVPPTPSAAYAKDRAGNRFCSTAKKFNVPCRVRSRGGQLPRRRFGNDSAYAI